MCSANRFSAEHFFGRTIVRPNKYFGRKSCSAEKMFGRKILYIYIGRVTVCYSDTPVLICLRVFCLTWLRVFCLTCLRVCYSDYPVLTCLLFVVEVPVRRGDWFLFVVEVLVRRGDSCSSWRFLFVVEVRLVVHATRPPGCPH